MTFSKSTQKGGKSEKKGWDFVARNEDDTRLYFTL